MPGVPGLDVGAAVAFVDVWGGVIVAAAVLAGLAALLLRRKPHGQTDDIPDRMLKIARCESGLRPHAFNPVGPYYGIFQFLMSTFHAHGGTDIWDPSQQAEITATMLSHGGARAWGCA